MEEAQPSAAPASAPVTGRKRTKGQVLAERRRAQQVLTNTTVIKTGFGKVCVDPNMAELLENSLAPFSQKAIEGALFRNYDILRRCEANIPLDKLDLTYFSQSLIAMDPNGLNDPRCKASDQLKESLELYKALRPDDYVELEKSKPFMARMLEEEAKLDYTNFTNWISAHFTGYLCRWIRMHIDDFYKISNCIIGRAKYVKSAVSLILTASTNKAHEHGMEAELEDLLSKYKSLADADLQPEDLSLIVDLVECIRERFFENFAPEGQSLLPLQLVKDTYHLYMPCLHRILVDLEARVEQIQQEIAGEANSGERHRPGTRVFSLLPQKSVKAHHMHVSCTIQRDMIKELAKAVEDEQLRKDYRIKADRPNHELFEGFYNFTRVVKHHGQPTARKKFMDSFKTDCIAVSVTVGVLRSAEEVAALDAEAEERK